MRLPLVFSRFGICPNISLNWRTGRVVMEVFSDWREDETREMAKGARGTGRVGQNCSSAPRSQRSNPQGGAEAGTCFPQQGTRQFSCRGPLQLLPRKHLRVAMLLGRTLRPCSERVVRIRSSASGGERYAVEDSMGQVPPTKHSPLREEKDIPPPFYVKEQGPGNVSPNTRNQAVVGRPMASSSASYSRPSAPHRCPVITLGECEYSRWAQLVPGVQQFASEMGTLQQDRRALRTQGVR